MTASNALMSSYSSLVGLTPDHLSCKEIRRVSPKGSHQGRDSGSEGQRCGARRSDLFSGKGSGKGSGSSTAGKVSDGKGTSRGSGKGTGKGTGKGKASKASKAQSSVGSPEEERQRLLEAATALAPQVSWERAKERPRALIQDFVQKFSKASPDVRNNRSLALAAVQVWGPLLMYCSQPFTNDSDVVLAAVATNGWALRYASPAMQSHREIVLTAVRQAGQALQFVSAALQDDREVVLAAVRQLPSSLSLASAELRNDREVVCAALQAEAALPPCTECVLRHAGPRLQADPDVVLEAVLHSGGSLKYANGDLRRDKEFVLKAVRAAQSIEKCKIFGEADDSLKLAIPWTDFERIADSALAAQGELAPVVTVTVSEDGDDSFMCEVIMLSGNMFSLRVPNLEVEAFASKVASELRKHSQADALRRVFLLFQVANDETVAATPWCWQQPLAAFAC